METTFHISLYVKTLTSFETYGTFDLGTDRGKAEATFDNLKGSKEVSEKTLLCMDLIEKQNGIPQPIDLLHCT